MAEALAVAGTVLTILNLVKYSEAAVSRVRDFRNHAKDTPQAFRNLQVALPFIAATLVKIKARAEAGNLEPDAANDVQALLLQTESKIQELNAIFKKYLPTAESTRREVLWKAITSVNQDKKVHDIAAEIMQTVQLFTLNTVTAAPSAEEISNIVTTDLATAIDGRLQDVIEKLKECSASAITNVNNRNQTRYSYYNGHTHIVNNFHFNVADAQVLEHISAVQGRKMEGIRPKMISNNSESQPAFSASATNNTRGVSPFNFFTADSTKPLSKDSRPSIRHGEPVLVSVSGPLRDPLNFAENGGENLPQVLPYESQQKSPYGFVEAVESNTSLAHSVSTHSSRSSRSKSSGTRTPSIHSPITPLSPFKPPQPPRAGFVELEGPAPSISAIQFDAPLLSPTRRLSHARSIESSWSDATRDYAPSDSSGTSGSSDLTAFHGENDGSVLDAPNALMRFASINVAKSPSAAKRAYLDAINQYLSLHTPDPCITVRKLRSLTAAELGLTLVVLDTAKHLRRAQQYSDEAFAAACRSPNPGDKLRVRLDKGNIKAREARVREKERASAMVVNSITGEAFDAFQLVVREVGREARSVDDYNTVAQALLGCARVAGKLQGVLAGPGRRVLSKDTYLKEALERVEMGLGLGAPADVAVERLMETMGQVRAMMRAAR